jgi:hypothetical protein
VVLHRPGASEPGENLVVAGQAPEAWLLDASGRRLHRWHLPLERAWPELAPAERARLARSDYWRHVRPLGGGHVLVLWPRLGVMRLDADSRPVWRVATAAHHALDVADDGAVYVLTRGERAGGTDVAGGTPGDAVLVLEPDGRERRRVDVATCLARAGADPAVGARVAAARRRAAGRSRDGRPPPWHPNGIQVLDGAHAGRLPGFRRGALLLSFRLPGLLAVLDPDAVCTAWALDGDWRDPHDPRLLATGTLLLVDDLGGGSAHGRSRVLEIDPRDGRRVGGWQGDAERSFDTHEGGAAQRLAGGGLLVTESSRGRAFELSPAGRRRCVWELVHPDRGGADGRFVPYLCRVQRLPHGFALGGAAPGAGPEPVPRRAD